MLNNYLVNLHIEYYHTAFFQNAAQSTFHQRCILQYHPLNDHKYLWTRDLIITFQLSQNIFYFQTFGKSEE